MVWENGVYWHYLSSWCQPDSINTSSQEWMRLWALSGRIVSESCVPFVCLPLPVMKTPSHMAGVCEAKPMLLFLVADMQIQYSLTAHQPLFLLRLSWSAFNRPVECVERNIFLTHNEANKTKRTWQQTTKPRPHPLKVLHPPSSIYHFMQLPVITF